MSEYTDSPTESTIHTLKSVSQSFDCMQLSDIVEPEILEGKGSYKIFVCAYALNPGCFIEGVDEDEEADENEDAALLSFQIPAVNKYVPFIQWIVAKDDKEEAEYNFPKLEYICTSNEDASGRIRDECILKIMSTVLKSETNYHTGSRGDFTDCFKGFVRVVEDPSLVYVVFDLTLYQDDVLPGLKWAIADELVYKQTVFDYPIGSSVAKFMDQYDCVLQTADGQDVPFPFQVYMCRRDDADGSYINVSVDDSDTEYLIEHEKYGMGYLFTADPVFVKSGSTDKLNRYALFVSNCEYILLPDRQKGGDKPILEKGVIEDVTEKLLEVNPTVLPGETSASSKKTGLLAEAETYVTDIGKGLQSLTQQNPFTKTEQKPVKAEPESAEVSAEASAEVSAEASAEVSAEASEKESAEESAEASAEASEKVSAEASAEEAESYAGPKLLPQDVPEAFDNYSFASTVYFVEENIQMWFVRNISQFKSY